MLWMNNTGLFSTRCDLVDECTEIMLRMGEEKWRAIPRVCAWCRHRVSQGRCLRMIPRAHNPASRKWHAGHTRVARSMRPGCRARAIRSAPPHLYPTARAGRRVSDEFIRELHRSGDELGHGREASSYILRYMDLLP